MNDLLKKLRALGEPTRLRIATLLWRGELTVGELVQILGQSQPRVSRHLRMLTEAGLAERLPEGAFVFYRLTKSELGRRLAALIEEMTSKDDPELARDLERLERVRAERAEAAERYRQVAAKDWERIAALHFPEAAVETALRAAVGPARFRRHLDVGTGTGRMLEVFAPQAEDGLGVDVSRDMLNLARANIAKRGLAHRFLRQADANALPLDAGAADLITVHHVLHYLDQPERAIAECARVLSPGGVLAIAEFAPHGLEFLRREHKHKHLGFSAEQIEAWLRAAGLALRACTALAPKADDDGRLTVLILAAGKPSAAARAVLTEEAAVP